MRVLHDLIEQINDYGNDYATLLKLLEEGENPNVADSSGNTPLHIAALKEVENEEELEANLQVVRELIYFVADVNLKNYRGNTPLHIAVARRKYKMVELFLHCDADMDIQNDFEKTPLQYAISNEQFLRKITFNSERPDEHSSAEFEIVKLLLSYCPDINKKNCDETSLIRDVKQQNLQMIKMLVKKGFLSSLKDTHGNEALHYALNQAETSVEIVAELIRAGSSHASKNGLLISPLDMYLNRLKRASATEQEKAKYVLKLFVFQNNKFKISRLKDILKLSKKKKSLLHQFFWYCRYEVEKMKSDELAVRYTVYDLASWGFFSTTCAVRHPSHEMFDKVLDKLKKGEYSVYCDIILSGICKKYLARKAAETVGSWNLNFDTIFKLCCYLTNFEIFNFMVAFTSSDSFLNVCEICNILYEKF